jgi:hypothetical protein
MDRNDSARLWRVAAIGRVGVIKGAAVVIGAFEVGSVRSLLN